MQSKKIDQSNEMIEYNKKNYRMSLLFIQTKELKRFYESKMDSFTKFYCTVDKEWLDQYKKYYDYLNTCKMFESFNEWKDYYDFKKVIGDSFLVEDSSFTKIYKNIGCKRKIYKNDIDYPINCELIFPQYLLDCLKGYVSSKSYDILIGDKSIIIIDENKKKDKAIIFLCSLIEGKENKNNFSIKVDYIINFNNMNILDNELKEISSSNGIINYLLKRKIDINKNEEQNLIN